MKSHDSSEILARKLDEMFPDFALREQVREELDMYGLESHEREIPRVRLAILKIAGASLEKVREWTAIAKRDYRDALACAEYPTELISPTWNLSPSECEAIRIKDAGQFQKWLEEK